MPLTVKGAQVPIIFVGGDGRPFLAVQVDVRRQHGAGRGAAAVDLFRKPRQLRAGADAVGIGLRAAARRLRLCGAVPLVGHAGVKGGRLVSRAHSLQLFIPFGLGRLQLLLRAGDLHGRQAGVQRLLERPGQGLQLLGSGLYTRQLMPHRRQHSPVGIQGIKLLAVSGIVVPLGGELCSVEILLSPDGQHRRHVQNCLVGRLRQLGRRPLLFAVSGDGLRLHALPALRRDILKCLQRVLGGVVVCLQQRPVVTAVAVIVVGDRVGVGAVLAVLVGAVAHILRAVDGLAVIQRLQGSRFLVLKGLFGRSQRLLLGRILGGRLLQLPCQHRPAVAHLVRGCVVCLVTVQVFQCVVYLAAVVPRPVDLIAVAALIGIQAVLAFNGLGVRHVVRQVIADACSTAEEVARRIVCGDRLRAFCPLGIQIVVVLRGGRGVAPDDVGRSIA